MTNFNAFAWKVVDHVKHVGAWIQEQQLSFGTDQVQVKGLNSLVSYVDQEAERMLVQGFLELLPGSAFITEEETVPQDGGSPYVWIIDPLDGTTNFIHGLPVYAISVALQHKGNTVLGIVHELGKNECFYAWDGHRPELNGNPIQVSQPQALSEALLATGFPYYEFGRMEQFMHLLQDFFKGSRGLRRLGSAATDLAYVACGRFDGFFEYGLNPWDVAAGAYLVERAGGKVSTFSGSGSALFEKEICAASPAIFTDFRKAIKLRMG